MMNNMDLKKELQNPKWWLIITALVHTFVGVLSQLDPDNDNELMVAGIFLIIPVIMFYAAFMTEGRDRARLAAVVAGPIFVWFVLCIALGLEITYTTDAFSWELSDNVPPLVFWGMTALTGVLGWNSEE
jgi:hypothetical protein